MTRVHGLLDPESAATVVPVFDAVTSPTAGWAALRGSGCGGPRRATSRATSAPTSRSPSTASSTWSPGRCRDDGRSRVAKPTVTLMVTRVTLLPATGPRPSRAERAHQHPDRRTPHLRRGFLPTISPRMASRSAWAAPATFSREPAPAIAARDGGCVFPGCAIPSGLDRGASHPRVAPRRRPDRRRETAVLPLPLPPHALLHNQGGGSFAATATTTSFPHRRRGPGGGQCCYCSKPPALARLLAQKPVSDRGAARRDPSDGPRAAGTRGGQVARYRLNAGRTPSAPRHDHRGSGAPIARPGSATAAPATARALTAARQHHITDG